MTEKVDSEVAAGGMNLSSKKGLQKVETNDNKDISEERRLRQRVRM